MKQRKWLVYWDFKDGETRIRADVVEAPTNTQAALIIKRKYGLNTTVLGEKEVLDETA